jgi:hypothetical protein
VEGKCVNKSSWYIMAKEFNDPDSFKNIAGWKIDNIDENSKDISSSPVSYCGKETLIFGGYKILAKVIK